MKAGDSIRDAIHTLYEKDIFSAAIVDMLDSDADNIMFSDQYIGLVDFTSMVLWCLEVLLVFLGNLVSVIPPPKCHAILITHMVFERNMKRPPTISNISSTVAFSPSWTIFLRLGKPRFPAFSLCYLHFVNIFEIKINLYFLSCRVKWKKQSIKFNSTIYKIRSILFFSSTRS